METREEIEQLYRKYLNETMSPAENDRLLHLFDTCNETDLNSVIEDYLNSSDLPGTLDTIEKHTAFLFQDIKTRTIAPPTKTINWPIIITVAAILMLITTAAIYFFNYNNQPLTNKTAKITSDILPGKFAATLTLANGKKIVLSSTRNGKLIEEAGLQITKDKDGKLSYKILENQSALNHTNTLSTARGETYQVILPDQSKVWLNAASSITYFTSLTKNRAERKVILIGEAYFEVKKDKSRPFIVQTASQVVKVLGTHFNINSYSNEKAIKTTLLEGSVAISSLGKGINQQPQLLKPGQQASLFKSGSISVEEVNVEDAIAWKNGKLAGDAISLIEVIADVERWYNVDFIIPKEFKNSEKAYISINRNEKLSFVLKALEHTYNVNFQVMGKEVHIR